MIDDMTFHTEVWYQIMVKEKGAQLSKEQVKQEMYGKNRDVLNRVFGEGYFLEDEIEKMSLEKERRYQELYRPHLKLINGLDSFLEKAYQCGIPMAIGSAAITFNIDFVLDGLQIRKYFPVTVSADDVQNSKPDPETFLKAAAGLKAKPEHCIVFEDNPKGVLSASKGGMKSVVITTMHTEEEFEGLSDVLFFIEDYTDPRLHKLLESIV